jgi:hypothetical protein
MYHYSAFKKLVSYNRFVELQKQTIIPLMLFLTLSCSDNATEISFIDSTKLRNILDNNEKVVQSISKNICGKMFGDKGYVSQKNLESLWNRGLQLITKIKKGMKNKLMDIYDKLLLKRRGVIESVNNILKNTCMLEHSRHRSVCNFFVNVLSALGAYMFLDKKPSIRGLNKKLIGVK